jgi:hypothetical protein
MSYKVVCDYVSMGLEKDVNYNIMRDLNNECKVKLFNDPYELESETERVVYV